MESEPCIDYNADTVPKHPFDLTSKKDLMDMFLSTSPLALMIVTTPEYFHWLRVPLFDALCVTLSLTFILHRLLHGPLWRRILLVVLVVSNLLATYFLLGGGPLGYSFGISAVVAVVVCFIRNGVGRIYQWSVQPKSVA